MERKNMLSEIQKQLKAPKNQNNNFGGYKYRSCEDILEAVKPLLPEGVSVILSDEMVAVGDRIYVKSTASLVPPAEMSTEKTHEAHGWAREAESKKGMDDAQITGSASSYARKYALNGLFAIDDTKDADATNDHGKKKKALSQVFKDTTDAITDLKELEKAGKMDRPEEEKAYIRKRYAVVKKEQE